MRRRPIALALLIWFVPACTAWHVEQGVTPQRADWSAPLGPARSPRWVGGESVTLEHECDPHQQKTKVHDKTVIYVRTANLEPHPPRFRSNAHARRPAGDSEDHPSEPQPHG